MTFWVAPAVDSGSAMIFASASLIFRAALSVRSPIRASYRKPIPAIVANPTIAIRPVPKDVPTLAKARIAMTAQTATQRNTNGFEDVFGMNRSRNDGRSVEITVAA